MDLRPGYKQTEIGVIPEDWEVHKLRDVCRLINGRGFKPHEWKSTGYPIIRIQNLNGSEDFNHFNGPFDPKIIVEPGQLLFAWSGSRGTSFGPHIWRGETGVLNYHTWKVMVNQKKIDETFFFYALRHLTEFIEENAHGASALVHTQKWEMEAFDLAVPPRPEQQAIAEALSDIDATIKNSAALIAKKRDVRSGAMQRLLTGDTRLPGFVEPWQEKTLGELVETDPENLGSDTARDLRFNYIALESVDNGRLLGWSEQFYGTAPSRARRKLRSGDVLLATVRPNLKAHLLFTNQDEKNSWVCSTGFCVLRSKPELADPAFIFAQLFGPSIPAQIEKLIAGSNYPAINSGDVRNLMIDVPGVEEQVAIAAALSDMDAEITALEARLEKTRALKQGMMQALLTGRVRLPVRAEALDALEVAHA